MTNELAIKIIAGEVLGTTEQTNEAVKMAVKALSLPDVPDTNVGDTISRQAAIESLFELYEYQRDIDPTEGADLVRQGVYLAEKRIEQLPSTQPEPFTDKEQRIFLVAMGREEKVCKQVDEECRDCREPYEDSLVRICHEIIRKVKGALWT